ncbi:MAG: SH3 domain-containing protein [Clostridiales bacterium]|nr:SH3 domain-containing protein [Clostridiales bacterium]
MKKQILSLALIAVMMAVFLPAQAVADSYYGTQYVYTDNGKTLNVRSAPSMGDNIIGSLKYGAEVTVVEMYSNGWAKILWEQNAYGEFGTAYVQRRFLVNHKPSSQPSQPAVVPASGSAAAGADYAKLFTAMNDEFRTGKLVPQQFNVYARPSRASGWVNLRWAPSLEAERIATCPQGKVLTVIAETRNWYQVRDPQTGMIGFISKQYVSVQ